MILPKIRDPRLTTVRRGGTLTDENHRLLALWAAQCAEQVLPLFEKENPLDVRPRRAIELTRAWARGETTATESKTGAYHSNLAAREQEGAAKFAALAAGQAAVVAHVPAHELGAAAYAIRAALSAGGKAITDEMGYAECRRQRDQLPQEIRRLVLEDQQNRNALCWNVFQPELRYLGERIALRPYWEADAASIHQWTQDKGTTKWMGPRYRNGRELNDVRSSLRGILAGKHKDSVFFAIADRETGRYLGGVDLTSLDRTDGNATLSIVIASAAQRSKGIGTEAIGLLLRHAFEDRNLHKVELRVSAGNETALRCYSRLGFREEGRLREHSLVDGRYVDLILMGILAGEYQSLRR